MSKRKNTFDPNTAVTLLGPTGYDNVIEILESLPELMALYDAVVAGGPGTLAADSIIEITDDNGVTIDLLTLIKDGAVTSTTFNGVALTTAGSATQFLGGDGIYQTLVETDISNLDKYTQSEADAAIAAAVALMNEISELTDTNIVTPAVRHALMWDGVDSWDNRLLVEADISNLDKYTQAEVTSAIATAIATKDELSELNDTNIVAPAVRHAIMWDGVDSWDNRLLVEADISDLDKYSQSAADTLFDLKANLSGGADFTGIVNFGDPGFESGAVLVNSISYDAVPVKINSFGTNIDAELILHKHSTTDTNHLVMSRSVSDTSSHGNVVNGTVLGSILFTGWHTSSYWMSSSIEAAIDGIPGALNDMPGKLIFNTSADGAAAPSVALTLHADKSAVFTGIVTGTSFNGVSLTTGGSATQFLGGDGNYQTLVEADISDLQSYEPADATILKDADIGVTLQAFDSTNTLDADVTYELLNTNGDVGTSAGQLAIGNHNHDATYLALNGATAMTGDLTISKAAPTVTMTDTAAGLGGCNFDAYNTVGYAGIGASGTTPANYGDGYIEWDLNGAGADLDKPYMVMGLRNRADTTIGRLILKETGAVELPECAKADIVSAKYLTTKEYVDDNFVAVTGDTMSGTLNIDGGSQLNLRATGNPQYPIIGMLDSSNNQRFRMQYNHDGTDTTSILKLDAVGAIECTMTLLSDGNVTLTGGSNVPTATAHLTRKDYVDTKLALTGGTLTGSVSGIAPTADAHLTRKDYVDDAIALESNPNIIINANFDIWQRGTSFAAAATSDYSTDRFQYSKSGAMVHTLSRSTDVPTYAESGIKSNYSLLVDCTTADASLAASDECAMTYKIEGYDYARIAGGNATLSFWVKGTKTGIHCIGFRNSIADRSYTTEYTINTTDTWEKKTITVPLTETAGTWDYINGLGLHVDFVLAAGTNKQTTADTWASGNYYATSNQVNACDNVANNFRIAQVKLERGDIATPLAPVIYADEMTRCQRYYQHMYKSTAFFDGYNVGTAQLVMHAQYLNEMRATPTSTISLTSLTNLNSGAVQAISTTSCTIRGIVTATGRGYMNVKDLKLDAEL